MTEKIHKSLNRVSVLGVMSTVLVIFAQAQGWIGNSAVQAKNISDLMDFKVNQGIINDQIFRDVSSIKESVKEVSTDVKWIVKTIK